MKISRERFDELVSRHNVEELDRSKGLHYDYGFYYRTHTLLWTTQWWHQDDTVFMDMLKAEEKLLMMEETLNGLGI